MKKTTMAVENGEWIMHGMEWEDPYRIRSWRELINWIQEIGFLPLFKNEVVGFSAEEHVSNLYWWTGDKEQDPWEWREIIAETKEVAYGKFFHRKSGFVSLQWFPRFANYRRDGYDFDARWEDELLNIRCKKIMDIFETGKEYTGLELKRAAGFGKGGEKKFDGVITDLQMQTYLTIKEFRRKRNKKGEKYGMPVSVYVKPEELWGYEFIAAAYQEDPRESWQHIYNHVKQLYPNAEDGQIRKLLK
ncbi:MAG: hypothetical protein ACI4EG_16015 [Fusicatenibacter sp.]